MKAMVLAAALLGSLTFGTTANAGIIFDFSGTCDSGCFGTATGTLTLDDSYVFGQNITSATFLSFDYASSDKVFQITAAPILVGGLNADGSFNGVGVLVILNGSLLFEAQPGTFAASVGGAFDIGETFTFTHAASVPEPATLALFGAGVITLGAIRRRRRANA